MENPAKAVYARLFNATFFFALVVVAGTVAYWSLGEGRWSVFDCLYMTMITLSTVGYGEVLRGMDQQVEARAITLALITLGSGTLVYFVSNLTALIVEGDLQGILRRRKMDRAIQRLNDHVIVCGVGATGKHVALELMTAGKPCVLVDRDEARLIEFRDDVGKDVLYVVGNAVDDHILQRAGIERAGGVVAALTDDKDNLFITITARALNAQARIVAKAIEPTTERKLRRAGANVVVSPNFIGGMRMASEMIRPAAVAFLDRMLRDRDGQTPLRIEEVRIPETSRLVGRKLAETGIRNQGALVIALALPDGEYVYNPPAEQVIVQGSALIVLASVPDVKKLRAAVVGDSLVA